MIYLLIYSLHYQVLSDGSVLRVNKTVIHDTDQQGNGFLFQSSVHQLVKEDQNESTEEEEEEIDEEDPIGFVDEDPILNEVFDEKTASVEDLFD